MRALKLLVVLVLLAAMPGIAPASAAEMPEIVCTSFPCYDFVRAVMGEAASVCMLIKPGAEVHSFEPTPADIMAIAGCDLFVYIGGESDAWVEDILESFGNDAPQTLRLMDCIGELAESDHGHDHGDAHHDMLAYDEHIWTSPANAMAMVQAVSARLCEISGENEAVFSANAAAYCDEIAMLHAQFAEAVESGMRHEMIFADRFPFIYFAHEYGIEYVSAFASCSSESEPSARVMMELIDRVIADDIPVVYTIELSSQRTAKTISAETGAKILTFHSIQNLTEADFAAGESYVSLMQRNLEALREGLN